MYAEVLTFPLALLITLKHNISRKIKNKHCSNTEIVIASRYNENPVYTITTKAKESIRLKRVQLVNQLQIEFN